MSVYSPVYHAMISSPSPPVTAAAPARAESAMAAAGKAEDQGEDFFDHLLDVINPLQHLPVIGTLYRAITGDKIGHIEKIAGDTLYGGLWGAVSAVASVAFEAVTGKSPEDTALAWFKGDDKPNVAVTKVAATAITASGTLPSADLPSLPPSVAVAANSPDSLPDSLEIAALTTALSAKGVNTETASRALYAYRRSMDLAPGSVLASVN